MERSRTIRRDFKAPAPTATARRLSSYRNHLLTLAGIMLGAGLIVSLMPHNAGATRSEPDSLLEPLGSLPLAEVPATTVGSDAAASIQGAAGIEAPIAGPGATVESPAMASEGHWLHASVRKGDNMSLIFSRHGLSGRELHDIMSLGGDTKALTRIYPGKEVRLLLDADGRLQALAYDIGEASTLHVERGDNGFTATTIEHAVERRVATASGAIQDSLFMAANRAGLSDNLIMELVHIFGWDVDFSLDIRQNDRFSVIYEELYMDGEKLRDGRILAAEFVNRDRQFKAIRYTDANGRSDYFAPDGQSMRKAFLRSPVEFTRVSSRFSSGRMHPVLNRIRAHKGVDYAAPPGTPVKSTGDGRVVLKGVHGGYGNTVIIQHGNRYSTLYAHLSRYARGLKQGDRVKQGQLIGYVGSSGLATGPHLHYEFRVDDIHRDPLKVKFPNASPVSEGYLTDFRNHAGPYLAQLDAIGQRMVAEGPAAEPQGDHADRIAFSSVR